MKKLIAIFGVLLALVTGCSHLNAKHLPQRPFQLNQTETTAMTFMDFRYSAMAEGGKYIIQGTAFPNTKALPGGGGWMHDLVLAAFLSDQDGRVLASDLSTYPTTRVSPEGVPFSFSMSSESIPAGQAAFLSFGYRMSLTQGEFDSPFQRRPLTDEKDVFSASEWPLSR